MRYYELVENTCRAVECGAPVFEKTYDLIVAGLGSAGSFLALSAAREGVSVLGVERGHCCGGMSVQGAVNGYYNGYEGGSYMAIDDDTNALNRKIYRPFYNNPDSKKHRIENELLAHGAELCFNSVVLGVYAENGTVAGVRLLLDGTVHEYGCRFLSDSTSDGHVLRMLGVPGWVGRPTDGATAPFSSVRIFKKQDGLLGRTNDDSGYLNPYDDEAFSTAVLTAHGKHLADSDQSRERYLYAAPQIGNREGMTFEGEQTLTLRDILDETPWDNTLCCVYSDIDKHGVDRAFDDTLYQDWFVISNLSTVTFKIRIPLGALVPKGWKGLVAVSRCLGIDNYASSAVRMNRDMYRLGEAAGAAVAQALQAGKESVLDIPYAPLRARVEELGCFDPRPNELRGFVQRSPEPLYVPVEWMTAWDEIAPALGTDRPGVAIWSCRRLGDKMREPLAGLLETGTAAQRGAAAIALGLMGDERCIPALRELVKNRSEYHYLDSRRSNQMPSVIAICLLGRFKDAQIVPDLLEILQPEEFEKPMYHVYLTPYYKLSIIKELNSVYYQHYSFAVATLAAIAKVHPHLHEEIFAALEKATETDDYIRRMTDDPEGSSIDLVARHLRRWIREQKNA